jgi:hypothetical protein
VRGLVFWLNRKKSKFYVVGRIGQIGPLEGVGGLFLAPFGKRGPSAVFLAI